LITVEKLHAALTLHIQNGNGKLPVAFGDCNKLHLASGYGASVVEDLGEYYLEEIHPDDREDDQIDNVFIIGE
jgi:hypothetical protein